MTHQAALHHPLRIFFGLVLAWVTTLYPLDAGASSQGLLSTADLGTGWKLANDGWFDSPRGPATTYTVAFERDVFQVLENGGPMLLTLGVDLLREPPPIEAVEQSVGGLLSMFGPESGVRVFDEPEVGRNAMWFVFDLDLGNIVPSPVQAPPGVMIGVVFESGNNLVTLTAIGVAGRLRVDDIAAIARTVAPRARQLQPLPEVPE